MLGVILQMTVVLPCRARAEGEGTHAGLLEDEEEEAMGPRLKSTSGKSRGLREEEGRESCARWVER